MTREEAMRRIKAWNLDSDDREVLEAIIPELRENDDERIRMELVAFFKEMQDTWHEVFWHDLQVESILAWLEKKKEQKPVDYDHEMWKNCVANFEGGKKEVIEHPEKYGLQKPAEWSEEDKQKLNRIYSIIGWAMDEHAFSSCKKLIGDKEGVELQDFLRSIAKPKPEWSDEDDEMIKRVIERIEAEIQYGDALTMAYGNQEIAWLRFLRPSWKPSEEQMNALEIAIVRCQMTGLESLYEDLKRLM